MAKPGTIPVTTILSRDLRKWLEHRAREEDKKLGPYIRKVLEAHRAASIEPLTPNTQHERST